MVISLCYIFASQGIYRENFPMLYCSKDYKNVTKDKKFLQSRFFTCFSGFASSLVKCKSFLSLELESSIFRNIRNFFRATFFFLFLRLESSISGNIRKTFFLENIRKFRFPKYKKTFFEKI